MIGLVWQGLRQHPLRTLFTLASVAVCVLALTTVDGMLGYMQAERNMDATRFDGSILLNAPGAGYPPFRNIIPEQTIADLFYLPGVVAGESTPLLFLVLEPPLNPMEPAAVIGLGLWPGRESAWTGETTAASGSRTLSGKGDDAVILGYQAARFYGITAAGEKMVFAERSWTITGILKQTGIFYVDNLVIMPLAVSQRAFAAEGWVSGVLLKTAGGAEENLAGALAAGFPGMEAHTQEDIRHLLAMELEMPQRFLGIITWTAFFIAILIISNIMTGAVRERSEEIPLIQSFGERRTAILGYTMTEALLLSLGGGALGALAAIPTAYILGWTWIITWGEMARVTGLVLAAGFLAGLHPSYQAARAYPRALRYDELRRRMEEVDAQKQAMDRAYRQQVRGRDEERERLARELHDQAIQSLVALKFHIAEKIPEKQADLQAGVNEVIETLRGLCADLRPPALDELGLPAALRSYADQLGERTGLKLLLRVEGGERRLPPELELTLFRVAQEALNNVWKHAQAAAAEITLHIDDKGVELTVSDRGRGFTLPERLESLAQEGHFGLISMRERLQLAGGTLSITSEKGTGTTVVAGITLPGE